MKRYYKGDIVEVLNLKKYDSQHTSVGERFYVKRTSVNPNVGVLLNNEIHYHCFFYESQICLYKRPLKNKILNFIDSFK